MKSKFLFFIIFGILIFVSINQGSKFNKSTINLSESVIGSYTTITKSIQNQISRHFNQANTIKVLQVQNLELERSATLLSTFANELNQILIDKNSTKYTPNVTLVKTLGYVNISDYNKIWIDEFKDYNTSKIYGLIYQGKSAGIVVPRNGKPMALLQNDPNSVFSVYIGEQKIPGIAHGNKRNIIIKYIPQWLEPKVGDEVFTSGLDGIFFSGVGVGTVVKVIDESSYQSVVVKPFANLNSPSYLYVVIKEK